MLPFCFVPRQSLDKIKNAWEYFFFFFLVSTDKDSREWESGDLIFSL